MELTTKMVEKIRKQDKQIIFKLMSKHLNCDFGSMNYYDFWPDDRPVLVCHLIIRSERLHKKQQTSTLLWSYGIVNTFHAELENIDNREMEKFLFSIL